MKKLMLAVGMIDLVLIMACQSHTTHITSDPRADSPGSGAKMLDSGGKIHVDSVIIDSTNYGPPKN